MPRVAAAFVVDTLIEADELASNAGRCGLSAAAAIFASRPGSGRHKPVTWSRPGGFSHSPKEVSASARSASEAVLCAAKFARAAAFSGRPERKLALITRRITPARGPGAFSSLTGKDSNFAG